MFDDENKYISNSTKTINPKNYSHNKSVPKYDKSDSKIKLKKKVEMNGMDAIKSRFKKRLIEINDELLDAIHYYNGPIDISCISSKNYAETIDELNLKFSKNGYKCKNIKINYFIVSNRFKTFSVEIVKIRNNMLYYLISKN